MKQKLSPSSTSALRIRSDYSHKSTQSGDNIPKHVLEPVRFVNPVTDKLQSGSPFVDSLFGHVFQKLPLFHLKL